MTQEEFKAWFEGFSENIEGQPNKKQWARICKRVDEIDGTQLTLPIYIERWLPYRQYYHDRWVGGWQGVTATSTGGLNTAQSFQGNAQTMLYNAGAAEYASTVAP